MEILAGYLNSILASCSPPSWATAIASLFVVISLSLSMYLLLQHLSAYKNPEEQKFLIGVILMVPCYAIESIVNDLKFTVNHAVEPVEKGFTRFNEKLHKISENIKKHEKEKKRNKDDRCLASSSPTRSVIRGIDDPLLTGSFSDSGATRGKSRRKKSG